MRRTNNKLKLTLIATSLLMLAPSAFQVMASVQPASSSIVSENTRAQKLRIEPLN